MTEDIIHIGENIKRIRKQKGLSQEALAIRAGLPRPRISDLERRQSVTTNTLAKIARGLGVNAFELLIPQEEQISNL